LAFLRLFVKVAHKPGFLSEPSQNGSLCERHIDEAGPHPIQEQFEPTAFRVELPAAPDWSDPAALPKADTHAVLIDFSRDPYRRKGRSTTSRLSDCMAAIKSATAVQNGFELRLRVTNCPRPGPS